MIAINLLTFFEDGINLVESIYTWNSQDWCPVVKIYQLTIYGKKKKKTTDFIRHVEVR